MILMALKRAIEWSPLPEVLQNLLWHLSWCMKKSQLLIIIHNNLWCDMRKPITWCKIDIWSYWYHVKVWIILFPELFIWICSDTGIKSYWCSKAIKNKEKHYNCDVNFLYFAVSPFATCDGFSQITSHIPPILWGECKVIGVQIVAFWMSW